MKSRDGMNFDNLPLGVSTQTAISYDDGQLTEPLDASDNCSSSGECWASTLWGTIPSNSSGGVSSAELGAGTLQRSSSIVSVSMAADGA